MYNIHLVHVDCFCKGNLGSNMVQHLSRLADVLRATKTNLSTVSHPVVGIQKSPKGSKSLVWLNFITGNICVFRIFYFYFVLFGGNIVGWKNKVLDWHKMIVIHSSIFSSGMSTQSSGSDLSGLRWPKWRGMIHAWVFSSASKELLKLAVDVFRCLF